MKNFKPLILFYDIETTLLLLYLFSLGKTVARHHQLLPGANMWGIICITYCWNDGKPAKVIKWNPKTGMKGIIQEFDKLVKKADLTLGKNSNKFDSRMINAIRAIEGLPGLPEWMFTREDLEQQMRKYFRLPSQSLDYISEKLGYGGKVPMDFSDWISISQYMQVLDLKHKGMDNKNLDIMSRYLFRKSRKDVLVIGKERFDKMCVYGLKDTEDTRALWYKLVEHFDPKFNMSTFSGIVCCKHEDCGSTNIIKDGTCVRARTTYQMYKCGTCRRYAGSRSISPVRGSLGRLG